MASRSEFADYCAELFGSLGLVRVRRMFGGHGIYVDDLFVAIVSGESLYLKADPQCAPAFEKAGGTRFTFESKGRAVSLQYWTPPPQAMDAPGLMEPWARLAMAAALRSRAGSPAAPRPGGTARGGRSRTGRRPTS
jgi:DNA transformation protein and related proteins